VELGVVAAHADPSLSRERGPAHAGVEYDDSSTVELAEGALTSSDSSVQINLAGAVIPPNGSLLLDLVF